MGDSDDFLQRDLDLLRIYCQTLALNKRQFAIYGFANVPAHIVFSLNESLDNIRKPKQSYVFLVSRSPIILVKTEISPD